MKDEFDLRLRTRLERLAEAVPVPVGRPEAGSIDVVRPRLAARSSVGTLAIAGSALLVLVAAIVIRGPARAPATGAQSPPAVVATGPTQSASAATVVPSARPTMPPAGVALPYPDGCAAYGLSTRRCDYIVAWAKRGAGYGETDQVRAQLLGDPECPDGSTTCSVVRTMSFIVRVRLIGPDGVSSDVPVFCGVEGNHSLLCTDKPVIQRRSPTMGGYTDVPCAGEAPDNPCASPVPTPDASAVAAARPLHVPRLDIPIDHIGTYTIQVGEASLPNGILSEASFDLVNESPTNVLVSSDGVFLQIESLDGGLPFENIYAHGWHPGTERVSATLTFTVESYDPGAVLEVTNLTVR